VGPFAYGVSENPLANIYAGVNYAINTYGNPGYLNVLGHGHGYDSGGFLPPGLSLAVNNTGRPELVTPLSRIPAPPGSGDGGGNIYITVQAGDCIDPNAVAKAIHEKLRRYKTKKGGALLGLS
jgi:SLT domain-containing protein